MIAGGWLGRLGSVGWVASLAAGTSTIARAACPTLPEAEAIPMGSTPSPPCGYAAAEAAGRAFAIAPAIGVSRGVALTRARLELGLRADRVQVRVAATAVRSGGETGYIGIDGESLVPAIQIAEARLDLPDAGFSLAAGVIDDPWVMTIEPAWAHPETVLPLATDQGYLPRSDTGALAGWTGPRGVAAAVVAITTGEGAARRERDDQVDLTAVVRVRPTPD
ncbi:MAG: hypothetical protein ABMB14_29090, partial [Myxococcota bacterium]